MSQVNVRSNLGLRALTVLFSLAIALVSLTAFPQRVAATESSADYMTSVAYTTPAARMQLRNAANTANATFTQGDGDDTASVSGFNDEYTIKLYQPSISLIPTVSAKAEWECAVTIDIGGGDFDNEDCSAIDLAAGDEATIIVTVEAENGDTNEYTFYVIRYSTDATLSALSVAGESFAPDFSSSVYRYTVTTGEETADIDPTVSDGDATYTCKKGSLTWENCDGALTVGANSIAILVTAGDGTTKLTYTIVITRVATTDNKIKKLTLSTGGLLTPGSNGTTFVRTSFSPGVFAYDLTSNSTLVDITVDLNNAGGDFDCTVTGAVGLVNAGDATGNSSGDTCELDLTGATSYTGNTLTVVVNPESGSSQSYVFTITIDEDTESDDVPSLITPVDSTRVGKRLVLPSLTALAGNYIDETRIMYQWYVCATDVAGAEDPDAVPTDCVAKTAAVGATYTVAASDVGKFVIGALIGQPGSVVSYTDGVEVLGNLGLADAAIPPAPEEAALAGAEIGEAMSLDNVAASDFTGIEGAGDIFIQWYRCTTEAKTPSSGAELSTPSGCKKIVGETSDTYTPEVDATDSTLNDSGKFLRARILLSPSGSAGWMVYTRTTSRVSGAPVNTALSAPSAPSTLSESVPTRTVTASNGSWVAHPTLVTSVAENFSYQWYVCRRSVLAASNTDPTTLFSSGEPRCDLLGGENAKTLVVTTEWCGMFLLVGVTADNTDFRGKGGTSAMRYSPTSAIRVAGTACN